MARRRKKTPDDETPAVPEASASQPEAPKPIEKRSTFVEINPSHKKDKPLVPPPVVVNDSAVKDLSNLIMKNPELFISCLGVDRYVRRSSSFIHDVKHGVAGVGRKGRPCLKFGGFSASQIHAHESSEFNQELGELVVQVQDRFIGVTRD